MKVQHLSRKMIRAIKPNTSAVFELPTKAACQSARMQVSHVRTIEDILLICHVEKESRLVTVTRLKEPEKEKDEQLKSE